MTDTMSSTSPPSMKALMDAVTQVTQVTSRPSLPYPYTHEQPINNNPFLFPGAATTTMPFQSTPMINMMGQHATAAVQPAVGTNHMNIIMGGMHSMVQGGPLRKRNHDSLLASEAAAVAKRARASTSTTTSYEAAEDRRVGRLEQNRLAAIESRRRKKHMVEELQRSVQFYSKANVTLKSQNADLEGQLLMAKQQILMNNTSNGAKSNASVHGAASASRSALQHPAQTKVAALMAPLHEAKASSNQPAIVHHTSSVVGYCPTTIFGNASNNNAEMERQAQQAQFAATQALYKTMGYPAGAAREAATTFSQFVGQTGIVPGLSPQPAAATSKTCTPSRREVSSAAGAAAPPAAMPQVVPTPLALHTLPKVEPQEDTTYIEALNRFAMQQAAAANAAAAAATAAIQAAHLHNQLKKNGAATSPAAVEAVPSLQLPFSFPVGMAAWPFQNQQVPFPKSD